jgi:hypothetical protein
MNTDIPPRTAQRRRVLVYLASGLALVAGVSCAVNAASTEKVTVNETKIDVTLQAIVDRNDRGEGFPDFGFMVSQQEYAEKWSAQPIFRLKADFPKELPKKRPEFLERIDFKKDPLAYINAVRDYAFEGNLPNWNPFENRIRQWYHIPWLHPTSVGANAYPPNGGTEGFRGLIKEAPLSPQQLGPDQKGKDGSYSVYAITLINDFAGYSMGQMWADPQNPDVKALDKRFGGGFPIGTVFAKLLFTDAPQGTDKIAYLENPLTWKGYITENFWTSTTRKVTDVHLLQMDISVRDERAPTGWVFGTFVYNGQLNKPNKFMNLVPVGLMWGNDPENRVNTTNPFPPTQTIVNKDLKETVIFESPQLPPQHLGWNGRLNGPADLNTTSCMSCHNAAQYPALTSLVPDGAVPDGGANPPAQGGTDPWMKWFQNIPCGTSMDNRAFSTDFSFQVAIALTNYFNVKGLAVQGAWASEYMLLPEEIARVPKSGPGMTPTPRR